MRTIVARLSLLLMIAGCHDDSAELQALRERAASCEVERDRLRTAAAAIPAKHVPTLDETLAADKQRLCELVHQNGRTRGCADDDECVKVGRCHLGPKGCEPASDADCECSDFCDSQKWCKLGERNGKPACVPF